MAFLSNFEGGEPPLGHIHLPPNFTGLLDTPFGNFLEIFLKIHDIDLILRHPSTQYSVEYTVQCRVHSSV